MFVSGPYGISNASMKLGVLFGECCISEVINQAALVLKYQMYPNASGFLMEGSKGTKLKNQTEEAHGIHGFCVCVFPCFANIIARDQWPLKEATDFNVFKDNKA